MGWCDDYKSDHYNKLIQFPFKYSAEKLYLKKNIYNIILILDFNMNPIIKKKGSAIFMHISNKKYSPTKGCVAISLKDMRLLLEKITNRSKITIYQDLDPKIRLPILKNVALYFKAVLQSEDIPKLSSFNPREALASYIYLK